MYKSISYAARYTIVNKNPNIVKINGRSYDTSSGEVVNVTDEVPAKQQIVDVVARSSASKSFSKSSHSKTASKNVVHNVTESKIPTQSHHQSNIQDIAQRPVKHLQSHPTESSKTLMRNVVQKPVAGRKARLVSQSRVDVALHQQNSIISPKLLAANVDVKRLKRAKVVPKSQFISHYSVGQNESKQHDIPMISLPPPTPPPRGTVRRSPVTRTETTNDMLDRAISRATSHEQPPYHLSRFQRHRHYSSRRIIGISALTIISIALTAFVIHQNMPNIRLDMASSRAGFAADFPGEQPTGYSLGPLNATSGAVAIQYQNPAVVNQSFTITEKPSTWDSATLREMYVEEHAAQYQTIEAGGRTIYLYGQQNATWVNGGIWYLISRAQSLTNQQLINLALSL